MTVQGIITLCYLTGVFMENISNTPERIESNGKNASLEWYSSIVFLTQDMELNPWCTGSIIDPQWVLTAGHCVSNTAPEELKLVAGMKNFNDTNSMQLRTAKRIVLHPSHPIKAFSSLGFYDYALVEVRQPFAINNSTVALMKLTENGWPRVREVKCKMAGWGDGPRREEPGLYVKDVTVVRSCPCAKDYILDRILCLVPIERDPTLGICSGDSGGALVCNERQVGVAHMLFSKHRCNLLYTGSARTICGRPGMVSTFMYVCPQITWIRSVVGNRIRQTSSC